MTTTHPRCTLLVGAALVLGVTACGGDDDTTAPTTAERPAATTEPPAPTTQPPVTTEPPAPTTQPPETTEPPTPTTEPATVTTKEEYIAAADAICGTTQTALADIELGADVTLDELVALVADRAVPALRAELEELRALTPPPEDAATIDAMIDAFATGVDAVEADPISLLTAEPLAEAQSVAQEYGFQVCGTGLIPELPTAGPGELTAEQQAVAASVEEFFDGSTPIERGLELLQDAERLESTLVATMAEPIAASLSTVVTDVAFPAEADCAGQGLDGGCAMVTHDLLLSGTVISPDVISYAVLEDGVWKLSADSFCAVSERGGVPCPA